MESKKLAGILCTILGALIMMYEFIYVRLTQGTIGAVGSVNLDVILVVAGFHLILIGPAMWLGEVPLALKRMIEIRRGYRPGEPKK